jgi:hypothetical protein
LEGHDECKDILEKEVCENKDNKNDCEWNKNKCEKKEPDFEDFAEGPLDFELNEETTRRRWRRMLRVTRWRRILRVRRRRRMLRV